MARTPDGSKPYTVSWLPADKETHEMRGARTLTEARRLRDKHKTDSACIYEHINWRRDSATGIWDSDMRLLEE